jgi:hypothetical protein
VEARDANNERWRGDLLVLADGGASALHATSPGLATLRRYAGYMLWRGLVSPGDLPSPQLLDARLRLATDPRHHFVAYSIPTAAGEISTASRVLNWGWYYPLPESAMRRLHDAELTDAPHAIGRHVVSPPGSPL